jgi:hypothetical protein
MANGNGKIWSAAATVFVVIATSVFTMIAVWEHANRRQEHEIIIVRIRTEMELIRQQANENINALVCTSKLNLFFQTQPKGTQVTWQDIPSEYWPCMPKNLIDERKYGR